MPLRSINQSINHKTYKVNETATLNLKTKKEYEDFQSTTERPVTWLNMGMT